MAGYHESKEELRRRLRRIEGQIRGLEKMVDDDRYCIDVLTQISSATRALQGVAMSLLDDHLRHCVSDAIASGNADANDKLTEAAAAVARLLKS
jgi:DNA-binding FrmR family transcriptional regulator